MRLAGPMLLVAAVLAAGCSTRQISQSPRTAMEQMLMSGAVDRALASLELPEVRRQRVFLDISRLKGYDVEYVQQVLRARLTQLEAILVDDPKDAQLVVEVASGGLGTEYHQFMIGVPSIPLLGTPLATPEAPLYRNADQRGLVKLFVFVRDSQGFVYSGYYFAGTRYASTQFLWWRRTGLNDVRDDWGRSCQQDAVHRNPQPCPTSQPTNWQNEGIGDGDWGP